MKGNKKILVYGSVAFDTVFDIHGKIQDEIILSNGKLGPQNLMFTAKKKTVLFGGTGANISYGLGQLNAKPLLFSVAGKDFKEELGRHLTSSGVQTSVFIDKTGYTAHFYGMSDERGEQIGVWQANSYYEHIDKINLTSTIKNKELKSVSIAIFSAGTGRGILKHITELRKLNGKKTKIIFDPGQVISVFYDKKLLEKTLRLSDILITNEVELLQMQKILGYDKKQIFSTGIETIIETKGEKGSFIHHSKENIFIKPVKAKKVVETTGAGDAYRAGFLYGLFNEYDMEDSCKIGSFIASESIKYKGGQSYKINKSDFKKYLGKLDATKS